jgi:predicted acetylornithine/succinylornithine family transaminase
VSRNRDIVERARRVLLGNYSPAPIALVSGKGCRVTDADGRSYLDLCAGIAVVAVGHAHPTLARAIAEQAGTLMHVSNLVHNLPAVELAEDLAKRTPFSRFFFCNSGAEANEALFKLARRHHYGRDERERVEFVAAQGSFHGRTFGALSLTGQTKYHEGMGPLVPGVRHVPYGDLDALREAVGARTAAVLLEPIQGEGGVIDAGDAYLRGARAVCDERGALLMFDEVQTGFGRTGRFLAAEHSGVVPDAVSLGKGIGAGFPLGAIGVREPLAGALPPGSHATTYGGNPLACAAARAVLGILDAEGLVERAQRVGEHLGRALERIARTEGLAGVEARGRGLLRGLKLAPGTDAPATLTRMREEGVLLSLAGGDVLRFTPPLTVTEAEVDEGIAVVERVLRTAPRKG